MSLVNNSLAADTANLPLPIRPKSLSPSGLSGGAWAAMWLIVLILLVIAIPKHVFAPTVPAAPSAPQMTVSPSVLLPVPVQPASAALAPTAPAATAPDMVKPIADIAKMTLDASKDKYDSIKDTYDKLFSVLVAMAALLTFLGFKGLESFISARASAEKSESRAGEAEQRAAQAEKRAELASQRAEAANAKLEEFLTVTNAKKNRAELNVSNGIALRETARVYRDCWKLVNPAKNVADMPDPALKVYNDYLEMSLYYLGIGMQEKDQIDERVIIRAMGTLCNVHRALNNFTDALQVAESIIATYGDADDSAHFNAACYCSLLGQQFAAANLVSQSGKYADRALGYLAGAIALDAINKMEAQKDEDFGWLKQSHPTKFEKLTA